MELFELLNHLCGLPIFLKSPTIARVSLLNKTNIHFPKTQPEASHKSVSPLTHTNPSYIKSLYIKTPSKAASQPASQLDDDQKRTLDPVGHRIQAWQVKSGSQGWLVNSLY